MMQNKRKKTFLEKHTRLAPIDETQLKAKVKPGENNQSEELNANAINDPQVTISLKTQSKIKKPLEIPAIDHTKQRAKL